MSGAPGPETKGGRPPILSSGSTRRSSHSCRLPFQEALSAVKPTRKRVFRGFNMGRLHSQADTVGCKITDFKVQ